MSGISVLSLETLTIHVFYRSSDKRITKSFSLWLVTNCLSNSVLSSLWKKVFVMSCLILYMKRSLDIKSNDVWWFCSIFHLKAYRRFVLKTSRIKYKTKLLCLSCNLLFSFHLQISLLIFFSDFLQVEVTESQWHVKMLK